MKKILFVHIAKTGGMSIRRILRQSYETNTFDCIHNQSLIRFEKGLRVSRNPLDVDSLELYDFAVIWIRHPLARLLSCYQYFIGGGLNRQGKKFFPADAEVQSLLKVIAPTFSDCCQNLLEVSLKIPHFCPAVDMLNALPHPLASLCFVGRQERFDSDVIKFFKLLDVNSESVKIEYHNYSIQSHFNGWDSVSREAAEEFYSQDFKRFGYLRSADSSSGFVQYWDAPPAPSQIAQRMDAWQLVHPNRIYRRFERLNSAEFIGDHYGMQLRDAFLDIRFPAMQADVFRIAYLLAEGGIWIDASTVCLASMESWLVCRDSLLLLRRHHQEHPRICTGLIVAPRAGHPLLAAAWTTIADRLLARNGNNVYRDFGPRVLRDLLASGRFDHCIDVLLEADLSSCLQLGSSGSLLGSGTHWSQRQQKESLYFSQPSAPQSGG